MRHQQHAIIANAPPPLPLPSSSSSSSLAPGAGVTKGGGGRVRSVSADCMSSSPRASTTTAATTRSGLTVDGQTDASATTTARADASRGSCDIVIAKDANNFTSVVTAEPQLSLCKTFQVVATTHAVPLNDCPASRLPVDRRCLPEVYKNLRKAPGAVLLIPGFASNRFVFNIGGGMGRQGPSFIEFLAKSGYDAFSMDLRGSREATSLKTCSPAFLKEHIESDVPSVITFIKSFGYEKVFLIGHSMGGAISCAVAGKYPNDVAGIVHLAGLYHYTFPYAKELISLYRTRCPHAFQSAVQTGAGILQSGASVALRTTQKIFSGSLTLFNMLTLGLFNHSPLTLSQSSQNTSLPAIEAPPESLSVSQQPSLEVVKYSLDAAVVLLKRQKIPLRLCVDFCVYFRKFLPDFVHLTFINLVKPEPWTPFSIDDPWDVVNRSAESPSIGIYLAITKMGFYQTALYNEWLLESSTQPNNPAATKGEPAAQIAASTSGDAKDAKKSRPLAPAVESDIVARRLSSFKLPHEGSHELLLDAIITPRLTNAHARNDTKTSTGIGVDLSDSLAFSSASTDTQPQSDKGAAEKGTNEKTLEHERDISEVGKPVDGEVLGANKRKESISRPPPDVSNQSDNANTQNPFHDSSWIDFGPYFEEFEKHKDIPIYFCPANDDKVLRNEDTLQGFRRSGSKWKDVIQYGSSSSSSLSARPTRGGVNGSSSKNGAPVSSSEKVERRNTKIPHPLPASSLKTNSSPEESPATKRKIPSSLVFTPLSSSSAAKTTAVKTETTGNAQKSVNSVNGGSSKAERPSVDWKPQYQIPEDYSYGHCDILGGRHAERVWETIVDWLNNTTGRQSRFKQRKFSTK